MGAPGDGSLKCCLVINLMNVAHQFNGHVLNQAGRIHDMSARSRSSWYMALGAIYPYALFHFLI